MPEPEKHKKVRSNKDKPGQTDSERSFLNISSVSFKVPASLNLKLFSCVGKKQRHKHKIKSKNDNKLKFILIDAENIEQNTLLIPHHTINKNSSVNAITPGTLISFLKKFNLQFNFISPKAKPSKINFNQESLSRQNFSSNLILIDCRFEYEFQGGSIRNSINIPDPSLIEHIFIKNRKLFCFNQFRFLFANQRGKTLDIEMFEEIKEQFLNSVSVRHHSPKNKQRTKKGNRCLSMRVKRTTDLKRGSYYYKEAKQDKEIITMAKPNQPISFDPANLIFRSQEVPLHKAQKAKRQRKKLDSLIIVFYCEFSSKRAPSCYSHLRHLDRMENMERYPYVYYPNIYLLEGGYSQFVTLNNKYCLGEGQKYQKMLDKQFRGKYLKENTKLNKIWDSIRKGERRQDASFY